MIGIFDSGFGGLTIYREIVKLLPDYDYLYLGDNARAPYGNRSHNTIREYTEEGINHLFDSGCSLILIACNTASSQVLRELQEKYLRAPKVTDKKILGVIRPMVEHAVEITKTGRIGVVGTRSTINSQSYSKEIANLRSDINVFGQACPLLVPLVEENWYTKPETKMILKKYLRPLKSHNIDTLVLGCTHYPFLIREFRQIMGKKVQIPHPGEIVAESLKDYLERHPEIESRLTKGRKRTFRTTDNPVSFGTVGSQFLGSQMGHIEQIHLPPNK